jgi:hypothetical protein
MDFDLLVKNIQPVFHTLNWKEKLRDDKVYFYVLGFELEEFIIELTTNYLYVTIPLKSKTSYVKRFYINDLFHALTFIHFHVNNYIRNYINDSERCELFLENKSCNLLLQNHKLKV